MADIGKSIDKRGERISALTETVGGALVTGFHLLALFTIGATIVWSAVHAFMGMVVKGQASLDDILLLFIYLELGAMVGIYFRTNHMPVRFLIYVAITALTRLLIESASVEHQSNWHTLVPAGGILILAAAVMVLRYGSYKYPSDPLQAGQADLPNPREEGGARAPR